MAHFALLWKARTIEKCRKNYEKEKLNSVRISNTEIEKRTLFQRLKNHDLNIKRRLCISFRKLYPEGSTVYNIFVYMKTDQTFPNFVLKSVIGFVGGIILTYLCFMFFVFQLSISLMHATIMSSIIGVLLTLGLAFSYRIRCLVFLLLPQFFSRVGRYTLTCYALVLILTGPATNTLKNSEVLSESMACAQEQIKTNVHQMNELSEKPMNAIKDSIKLMIDRRQRQVAGKLKKALLTINRLVLSIVNVIQSSFAWLTSVSKACHKKLGTPYERCTKALNDAVLDCQASFGPRFSKLCNVNYAADAACGAVKHLKTFCATFELMNDSIVGSVKRKLRTFTDRVNSMLQVKVHVHHTYSFSSNSSRSASQVTAGIVTEIRKRADPLLTWLSWSSCLTSLFLLLIIFRAKYYQYMFETRSRFDNRYVTKELRDLDLKRLRQCRETVLPLNRRENTKYIKTTSFRLVASEKVHLSRSAVFMVITSFKLMIHMVADYSLYWVLMTIRHHGRSQSPLQTEYPNSGAYIPDSGPLSRIIRSILWSVSLPLAPSAPSPVYCLPDPYPPDLQRYTQIGILIVLLWFFALFEPYGLRLRHVIMGLYRPERAKARAVWLYNHIQRTRGGFMKFARRKLHREYKYSTEAKYTFKRWLDSHLPFSFLRAILGTSPGEPKCLLCGVVEYQNDPDTQIVRCEIDNCPGTYCSSCFSDIGNLCTICLSPIDYGDLSDISLEKGSSAESSDSEDDTDKDFKPANNPNAENSLEPSLPETDDSDYSIQKREPLKKFEWKFFTRKKNNRTQEGVPLLKHVGGMLENNISDTNNARIRKKALIVRHRKYCTRDHNDNNLSSSSQNKFLKHNVAPFSCKYCQPHNKVCDRNAVSSPVKDIEMQDNIRSIDKGKTSFKPKKKDSGDYLNVKKLVVNRSQPKHFMKVRAYSIKYISKALKKTNQSKTQKTSVLQHHTSILIKRRKRNSTSLQKKRRSGITLNWSKPSIKLLDVSTLRYINQSVKFSRMVKISNHIRNKRHSQRNVNRMLCFKRKEIKSDKFPDKVSYAVKNHGNKNNAKAAKKKPKNINMVVRCDNNPKAKPFTIKVEAENTDNSDSSGQDGETPGYSYSSKKFRIYSGKIRYLFANYLPKPKFGFSPNCKFLINYFRKEDAQLKHERINHKRRKKSIDEDSSTNTLKKHKSNKKDNEDTRKYRLSTYLSDQDWIKKRLNKKVSSTKHNKDILKMINECNEAAILKTETELEKREANVPTKIIRWKRENNLDSACLKQKHDLKNNNLIVIEKAKPFQSNAQKNLKLPPVSSSSTYVGKTINVLNMSGNDEDQYRENMMEESYTSTTSIDFRMSRTLNFYRSLGHDDFDSRPKINSVDQFIDHLYEENKESAEFNKIKHYTNHKDSRCQSLNKEVQPVEDSPSCSKLKPKQTRWQGINDIKIDDTKQDFSQENKEAENHTAMDDTGQLSDSGCPLSFIKYLLCRRRPKKCNKDKKEDNELERQVNEDANVFPVVQPCACQHLSKIQLFEDRATQYLSTKDVSLSISKHVQDAEVDAEARTCTCAAQYVTLCKDVGTLHKSKPKKAACKDASTIHYNALRVKSCRDAATVHYNCFKGMHNSAIQCCRNIKDSHTQSPRSKSATVTYAPSTKDKPQERNKRSTYVTRLHKDIVSSVEALHSRCSFKSDEGTKTDTTICSCTIDYLDDTNKRKKTKRLKVNVITKTNQSTATDKKHYCDIGTVTNDWWSPIVERKEKQISLVNKRASYWRTERLKNMEMKVRKQRGILTEGKVVKFQSRAQIIPTGIDDILSPSRYLLESQKYYNELFSPKFYAPHFIAAMTSVQTQQNLDKKRASIHTRKGYRPKRLEEGYSPRKLTSQKKFEYKWTAETGNQMRSSVFKDRHRTDTKLNVTKKPRNSRMQVYEKETTNKMKSEESLLKRGFTTSDDLRISQVGHCPSAGTTGSY